MPIPAVLSIAGSDSGGGAGIQADLKAFAACGVHGMTAITAITAQNTVGVTAVHPIPGDVILAQVRAVAEDIGVDAVKVGMLGDAATIAAVAQALDELGPDVPVVVDPVMVSESGAILLAEDAREALKSEILPRATVVTPNLPEARVLAKGGGGEAPEGRPAGGGGGAPEGGPPGGEGAPEQLARAIRNLGVDVVVVTGGHGDRATDVLFDGTELHEIPGERHPDGAAHGSGCTHSSTLAAHLAHGHTPLEAARAARRAAADAVRDGLRDIGHGPGPVDVLHVAERPPARVIDRPRGLA